MTPPTATVTPPAPDAPASRKAAEELDDERDRDELRNRYDMLLQELRVLLPGSQVLVAFMLTAPFSQQFAQLDDVGRAVFGAALLAGVLSIVMFTGPTAFHRFGPRTERSRRLVAGIRMTRIGLLLLATSMTLASFVVTRFIFGSGAAIAFSVVVVSALVVVWGVIPLVRRAESDDERGRHNVSRPAASA